MSRLFRRPPTPTLPQLPKSAGFTLIEVIVVLTLVGVATAISIPKISTVVEQTKVQRAAQTLQMEVQQAFAIAGRNRSPVTLRWNNGSMQLQVTNLAGTIVYRRAGVGTQSAYGLSGNEVAVTPVVLTVFPNGLAADTLVIKVSRRSYSRTIRVSRSGMVRLQ